MGSIIYRVRAEERQAVEREIESSKREHQEAMLARDVEDLLDKVLRDRETDEVFLEEIHDVSFALPLMVQEQHPEVVRLVADFHFSAYHVLAGGKHTLDLVQALEGSRVVLDLPLIVRTPWSADCLAKDP
jgi:hypothetical protein